MGTLTGEKIKDKYGELLKLESEGTSTYKSVETGKAEAIGLKLSQDGIEVQGLKFTTDPSTSNSELTALLYDNTTKTVGDQRSRLYSLYGFFIQYIQNSKCKRSKRCCCR